MTPTTPRKSSKAARKAKLRAVVLVSGGGTTLQAMIDRVKKGTLDVELAGVICSRSGAHAIARAEKNGVPVRVVNRKDYKKHGAREEEFFNRDLGRAIEEFDPGLVVLAGFMSKLGPAIVRRYWGRILNTHPALIPSFCGQGMYGAKVHEAVVAAGVKLSGCTIHIVDENYDRGPIVAQKAVPVEWDDTPQTLADRVQRVERRLYCDAIQAFAEGRVTVEGRKARVLKPSRRRG